VFTHVKYVLFDLNGTIVVGKYPDWQRLLEDVMGYQRLTLSDLSLDVFRSIARGHQSFFEALSNFYRIEDETDLNTIVLNRYISGITLRRSAIKTLKTLVDRYELVLCSDTTGTAKVLVEKFQLEKYFSKMFFSCDIGFLKSEREFWNYVLSHYSTAKPTDFLMVGDNPRPDIYWPKRLGMRTILITSDISSPQDYTAHPTGSIYEQPDHSIKDIAEVLYLLP
jgi:FMN phosphatase YigB (HAD superfamily)